VYRSKPQFQKYLKRGYHVEVMVETAKKEERRVRRGIPGFAYWTREFEKCCSIMKVDKMRHVKVSQI
jgi:3'-phosphoadenosine 5'-phosphosulfate sulfotransferase (PAPS reductase)/FAD synthetase